MASQSEELAIIVRVQDLASRALKSISRELGGLEKGAWSAGRAATRGVGTAIGNLERLAVAGAGLAAGGGAAAIKWAGDFEAGMNTINTVAMKSPEILKAAGDGIRQIARDTGVALGDLQQGEYDLVSAGIALESSQAGLTQATHLSIGALGTNAEAVDVLTTAINSYNLKAKDGTVTTATWAKVSDELAQAVADGKTTLSAIAASYAQVAPVAAQAGIGTNEVAAALGFLTAKGNPAAETVTQMARAIIELQKPTADLTSLQTKFHKNYAEIAADKGLNIALEQMREDATKAGVPFIDLFGRIEAYKFALQTTGPNAAAFAAELDKVNHSAGMTNKQFDERAQGFNYQLGRLKALAKDAAITVGTALLPEVTDLISQLNDLATAHQADIASFAKDLAAGFHEAVQWAEKLDIGAIANDLKAAGGFAKGIVEAFMNAPGWLQQAVITGWGLNKLTGGAVVDIGVDLTKGLIGQFAARGASPANPMWVAQVGGPGGLGAAAGAGGSVLGAIAAPVLAVAAVGTVAAVENMQISDQSDALRQQTRDYIQIATDQDIANSIDGVRKDLAGMDGIGANAYGQKGTTTDVLNILIAEQNRRATEQQHEASVAYTAAGERDEALYGATTTQTQAAEMNARRMEAAENRTGAIVGASGAVIGHELDALHQSFKTDLGALVHATKPVDVAAAARKVAAEITKGVGNLATTNHVLATLRAQLSHTHDPATAAVLRAAITAVEKKIPGREYATAELHKADEIVRSNKSTKEKVAELKTIEQQLKDHGLPNAASRINARINAVKHSVDVLPGRIKNALGGFLYGGTSSGKTGKDDVYHPSTSSSSSTSSSGSGSASSEHGRAGGGEVYPGITYRIGERGEEMFQPHVPGRVIAHNAAPGLMSAGAARAVVVQLQLTLHVTPKLTLGLRDLQTRTAQELRLGKVTAG